MNTFTKAERIVSQKLIDSMFTKGGQSHSLTAYPLRAVYLLTDNADAAQPPVQLLLSVSKRRFKHAVDRNRVKRQLRETYRHHKVLIAPAVPQGRRLAVALIWLADSLQPSADVAVHSVCDVLPNWMMAANNPAELARTDSVMISSLICFIFLKNTSWRNYKGPKR